MHGIGGTWNRKLSCHRSQCEIRQTLYRLSYPGSSSIVLFIVYYLICFACVNEMLTLHRFRFCLMWLRPYIHFRFQVYWNTIRFLLIRLVWCLKCVFVWWLEIQAKFSLWNTEFEHKSSHFMSSNWTESKAKNIWLFLVQMFRLVYLTCSFTSQNNLQRNGVFPKWSINLGNLGNLTNHWSMN